MVLFAYLSFHPSMRLHEILSSTVYQQRLQDLYGIIIVINH